MGCVHLCYAVENGTDAFDSGVGFESDEGEAAGGAVDEGAVVEGEVVGIPGLCGAVEGVEDGFSRG